MDKSKKLGINSTCVHVGEVKDEQFKGAISPIYMSTSYAFDGVDVKRYPRYLNTPNQEMLCKKIAALEHSEDALIFSSGMAAISNAMLAFLQKGDHVIIQQVIYGGTYNFVVAEFDKYGIEYSFTESDNADDFKSLIKKNTKILYIETPSNPLLGITDMKAISVLAKQHEIITMMDNTFASPINQNPVDFGIDIILHSATKYMGGHSDISAGAVAASKEHIEQIWKTAINFGGNLSDQTVWLLERSLKTMNLRVKEQTKNAQTMAEYFEGNPNIDKVYYPGLKSHLQYEIAKKQMKGFGAMLSFELKKGIDAMKFQNSLQLIKPSMSLAGVESTTVSPTQTTHALLNEEERLERGIKDGLIRFSVGIEETEDLIADIEQAIKKAKN
ncbi:MAG: PLP-dependent aspartate aminotransferase family protein [Polaribacter sp.]|uniref:trans-sulfuration enzyme family protein n=1 Tax=Polaribacter sp. TaxID=1920175 RepID=UPI002616BC99|nr:PLP-dependent aspartate aminotransferase family protein [Polaribacter sp.]MBT3742656.1 PLP-dependent transferase [Polaribacter sp.]MDG1194709.1 PLP-dependent aspartate aminotransferase family protein [Polaribacter sp.]MDG1403848.1 PLP-dependent aspartate aminotransferase family protein [Polaribacter sp.]MDG2436163.1 PLP-dependent aspartate aminotransferase family protein [Polaribacter sp.]